MKKTNLFLKVLLLALISALIATIAFGMTGCNQTPKDDISSSVSVATGVKEIGTGSTQFNFTVVTADGNETNFVVNTDKKTVGEALLENRIIAGEEGPYGLYVKTVNGVTLDFDKDGMYWAFYVNGDYATSGVEKTEITANTEYALKAQK